MLKIAINLFYPPVQQLKDFIIQNKDIFVPINGGSSLKNDLWCQDNLLFDDDGDNISSHNNRLNENTSIYWFWKHLDRFDGIDYCGFNHYRRVFSRSSLCDYQQYDIIVAQPIPCLYSLEWQYGYYHSIDDLYKCISLLKKIDYSFGCGFEQYVKVQHDNFAPMNMFVLRLDLFKEWCSFIFPMLFALENTIDVRGRDNYQKRAICFLEERIFGFWCWSKMRIGCHIKQVSIDEHLDWKDNKLNERGTY